VKQVVKKTQFAQFSRAGEKYTRENELGRGGLIRQTHGSKIAQVQKTKTANGAPKEGRGRVKTRYSSERWIWVGTSHLMEKKKQRRGPTKKGLSLCRVSIVAGNSKKGRTHKGTLKGEIK